MQSSSHVSDAESGVQKPKPIDWESVRLPVELHEKLQLVKQSKIDEKISVYEGFGSFHSENVEDLIHMSDAEYTTPRNLPTFARRLLTAEQLQQLALLKCHSGHRAERRNTSAASGNRKRERTEADGTGPLPGLSTGAARGLPTPRAAAPTSVAAAECDGASGGASSTCSGADGEGPGALGDDGSLSGCPHLPRLPGHPSYEELLVRLVTEPTQPCAMGQEFRDKYFMITPRVTFINHGAFGSSLVGAAAIKRGYEEMMESEVVEFVDRELLPLIVYSIRSLSRFLKADPRQVVLLQNATFALNCAMRLIEKGDVVAFLDTEYLSVYKMMWFRCKEVGASHHEIALSRFLHDDAIMGDDAALTAEIVRQLPAGCTTMVLDCITSTSALCMPIFSHLIPALRKHGVTKIIVDGAHSPLQVDLNFTALPPESQPTVFVGNLHKWFSSPKSVGFLWVRAESMSSIHSVVLSHGAGDGLLSEFIWDGTRDYGAYLSVPATVEFWEAQGVERVREYCTHLLESAVEMLTAAFRSRRVARHSPFMSLVELPEELQDDFVTAKHIQDVLHDTYAIEVPVKRVEGRYYLRISAFVYNTPQEYVYLREAVRDIANRWFHSDERRNMVLAAARAASAKAHQRQSGERASNASTSGEDEQQAEVPCDERIRRQGGCGVSGLDPTLKRRKTRKF